MEIVLKNIYKIGPGQNIGSLEDLREKKNAIKKQVKWLGLGENKESSAFGEYLREYSYHCRGILRGVS